MTYYFDPKTGRFDVDRYSTLWPLPWEPDHISSVPTP
jgi:hypothetical protein